MADLVPPHRCLGAALLSLAAVACGAGAGPAIVAPGEAIADGADGTGAPQADPLPEGALLRLGSLRARHPEPIQDIAWSPDGARIATAGDDRTVRVWDARSGRRLLTLPDHGEHARAVAFTPDGRMIYTGDFKGVVHAWDAATGARRASVEKHRLYLEQLMVSGDGRRLVSRGGDDLLIWEAPALRLLQRIGRDQAVVFALGAARKDGSLALGRREPGREAPLVVWNTATGDTLATLAVKLRRPEVAAFSPDGRLLAIATEGAELLFFALPSGEPRALRLPDQPAVKESSILDGTKIRAVAFSPDGAHLATADSWSGVTLWDARARVPLRRLAPADPGLPLRYLEHLAFSPDGRALAAAGFDGLLHLWDIPSGRRRFVFPGHFDEVTSVAVSPDDRWIASGGEDHTVRLWNPETGAVSRVLGAERSIHSIAFSDDGRRIFAGTDHVQIPVWDAPTGARLRTLEAEADERGLVKPVRDLALSPGGELLASLTPYRIRLWDAGTYAMVAEQIGFDMWSLSWSPDGRRLVTQDDDRALRFYDVPARRAALESWEGHEETILATAYSPDGALLVSGDTAGVLRVWRADSGRALHVLRGAHDKGISSIAWSPDGRRLATGSYDRAARLWDTASWSVVTTLNGHEAHVTAVAFTHDGRRLVTASADTTLLIWSVR